MNKKTVMNPYRSDHGFSLIETLVASALVGLWAISCQQLIPTGLAAIKNVERKVHAIEVLHHYRHDAHRAWANGHSPPSETRSDPFIIHAHVTSIDENNAAVDVKVSRDAEPLYSLKIWLHR